jgi:long-chain fatty acid transport protein
LKRYTLALFLILVSCTSQRSYAYGPAFSRLYAAVDSAETASSNPAGMTRFDQKTTSVGITFLNSFKKFEVDESRTTTSGGDPDSRSPVLVPAYYTIRPIDEKWRFGFAVNATGGFGADNGSSWAGRYYSDEFSLAFIGLTPSIAYPVNDKLSLGFSVPVTISRTETTSTINSPVPGADDGKLEIEDTEASHSFVFSSLYEFSGKTRAAIIYRSEVEFDSEPDIDIKRYSLPGDVVDKIEDAINTLEAKTKQPQSISVGLFHQLDNGWQLTADALWIDFSEFGVTEISIVGQTVVAPDNNFKDIYVFTVGAQFPVDGDTTWQIGALYVSPGVDDEDRTFSFALDRTYGVGVGFSRELSGGNAYNFNVNLLDTGKAPVDTGDDPVRGRVAGESENHYAITLNYTFHWR